MEEIKTIENDLKETIRIIRESFGEGYAVKNPELVRFLMDTLQREKDRSFNKGLNRIT
jgi:hypothetical protein